MSVLGPILLAGSLAVPAAFLVACFVPRVRGAALAWQWLAPISALLAAAAALAAGPFDLEAPALKLSLRLDLPAALLLAVSALLWIAVGAGAFLDRAGRPKPRFAVSWLLTLIGSLGVFVADDLLSFYLVYALVSIPAYGMFAFDPSPEAARAGRVYMAFAILGEAFLLLAFGMLAAGEPHGSLRIPDVVAALPGSPWRDAALALLVAGFGAKMGLVPLNGWMPLAYAATPIPAVAVLSGAGVKAGVIGLMRFLPLGVPLSGWGDALAALGFVTAFYGALIGVTQQNPKAVLAYSSLSQMGVIAAALGVALAAGDSNAPSLVAFYAANHVLVKGALFLAVGAFSARGVRPAIWPLLAVALALSLAGLPLTGGALAKAATKPLFGYGVASFLASASSAGSAMLMLHFVSRLSFSSRFDATESPAWLVRLWPAAALGALFLPYLLFPFVGAFGDALSFSKLWDGLWPILVGGLLAVWLRRIADRVPRIPTGDTIVLGEAAFDRTLALGALFDRMDGAFRRWPAAGLALLAIALALAYATAYAA
jgi:formate hydrogenlyase subunit 3/multisubunit Na+/H+ antiporter MnhD subunit